MAVKVQATGYVKLINEMRVNGVREVVTRVTVAGHLWNSWSYDAKVFLLNRIIMKVTNNFFEFDNGF